MCIWPSGPALAICVSPGKPSICKLLRRRWREQRLLLLDLELRLDLDLYSDDDSEDREYVQWLFEDEYAEAMSYTRGMTEPLAAAGRAGRLR